GERITADQAVEAVPGVLGRVADGAGALAGAALGGGPGVAGLLRHRRGPVRHLVLYLGGGGAAGVGDALARLLAELAAGAAGLCRATAVLFVRHTKSPRAMQNGRAIL